jgi:tetratricopeptide (TPR) repeat protein
MKTGKELSKEKQDLFLEGLRLYREKKYPESLEYFQRLAALSPDNHRTQYFLGLARMRIGRAAEAMINFSQAEILLSLCDLPEKEKEVLKKILFYYRAYCFCELEKFKKAADILFEQVGQKTGDNFQKALCLYQDGNFSEAAEILFEQVGQETCE